jgi:peptidoglycan/LPS O-acetylase OafA/YrhL
MPHPRDWTHSGAWRSNFSSTRSAPSLWRWDCASICCRRFVFFCLVRFLLSNPANFYSNDFFSFFIAGLSVAAYRKGDARLAIVGVVTATLLELNHLLLGYQQPSAPLGWSRFAMLLITTGAIFIASHYKAPRFLKPLALVGLVSYPLYLLHQDLGTMLFAWLAISPADIFTRSSVVLIFIGAAYLIYFYVERPWMEPLTDAIARRRRAAATA